MITVCIVGCEHTEVFVEVFIEQIVYLFRRGSCRRIGAIRLIVDVGTIVGIGEDGKMIGGVSL